MKSNKTFHISLLSGVLNNGLNQLDCQFEDLDLWLGSQIHFTDVHAVAETLKLKTKTKEAVIGYEITTFLELDVFFVRPS